MIDQLKIFTLNSFFLFGFFILTSFSSNNNAILMRDNTCTLHVKTSYGSDAKSVKVSTDVSGGISCIGGRSFYTNSDGMVTQEWSSGCYLKSIYVDGTGYKVDYRDGGDYTVIMK